MRQGHTLLELMIVLTIVGICLAVAIPTLTGVLDWIAADGAAHEVTTALAATRQVAVARGVAARLRMAPESLVVDVRDSLGWVPWRHFPGPSSRGVRLEVSNPEVVFSPLGVGLGASNTTVTLIRGSHQTRITTSRVGRVKRW
ncbi:MAG TPA: GspH/FimT family pseudopilin [Gemmatimonadales bacterium]|jgi:prepilin-type N-terminal cleavage/methylation domain-containing protein|nr:GspH/FimT family pseudopilin [Gemmatimonadales bacterium]